jgi:hypothetical protein
MLALGSCEYDGEHSDYLKELGNTWLAERLSVSLEELCLKELVRASIEYVLILTVME